MWCKFSDVFNQFKDPGTKETFDDLDLRYKL